MELGFYSLLVGFLLLGIGILFRTRRRRRRYGNLPPSPPAVSFIGHLHLLKPSVHRYLQSLSQKYGPIFSLRFGSQLVVVVSSPSAVEECFTKNDQPPSPDVRQARGVQLHHNGLGTVRRALTQPPPPRRPGDILLESP